MRRWPPFPIPMARLVTSALFWVQWSPASLLFHTLLGLLRVYRNVVRWGVAWGPVVPPPPHLRLFEGVQCLFSSPSACLDLELRDSWCAERVGGTPTIRKQFEYLPPRTGNASPMHFSKLGECRTLSTR